MEGGRLGAKAGGGAGGRGGGEGQGSSRHSGRGGSRKGQEDGGDPEGREARFLSRARPGNPALVLPKVLPADKWASNSPFLLPAVPTPPIRPQPPGDPQLPHAGQASGLGKSLHRGGEPGHPGATLPGREGLPGWGRKDQTHTQRWTFGSAGSVGPQDADFFSLEGWWVGEERARAPSGVRAGPQEGGPAPGWARVCSGGGRGKATGR